MDLLSILLSNHVLNVGMLSWMMAQFLKTLLYLYITKEIRLERLIGAGGMPSAHSATVCSITVAVAKVEGYSSTLFALSFALAAIVMYDAMGVRRAAGEHAKFINMIINRDFTDLKNHFPKDKEQLKEFLGHTPLEVLGGVVLGVTIGLFLPVYGA